MGFSKLGVDLESGRKRFIAGVFLVILAFVLFEALRGHSFWNKVKGEGNLWNYGSSLLDFTVGLVAIGNAVLVRYYAHLRDSRRLSYACITWVFVGIAFTYFACDEMLTIHEKMGIAIERMYPSLPVSGDGLIMGAYLLGGLIFGTRFLASRMAGRTAKTYFILGACAIGLATMLDVLPRDLYMRYLPFRETEELLELLTGWAFISSFVSFAVRYIMRILSEVRDPEIPEQQWAIHP